jgi:hypothetical protein
MTTGLIISLSILSGIYLERGRKWVIRAIKDYREVRDIKAFRGEMKAIREDLKNRQHAMEDRLGKPSSCMPFAGGMANCGPADFGEHSGLKEPSLEDQLKDALEHEEFERAAVLRDKMKER